MNRLEKVTHYALLITAVVLVGVFLNFWITPEHIPNRLDGNWHYAELASFWTLTIVVMGYSLLSLLTVLTVTRTIKPRQDPPAPQEGLKVAIITTYVPGSEPIDMLRRTLVCMLNAKYPHDVWLLDEGSDHEARELCEELGVRYFTRHGVEKYNTKRGRFARKTKGGNHNAWYDAHGYEYDIVAQFDTDFEVHEDVLLRTLGHFSNPKVGAVITPQVYGNVDESFIARGAAEQTYLFYGPIQRALSSQDMAFLIGANHVIRVKALEDVDWYGAHLTEDLMTGQRLHAGRWETVYVPEVLAVGEGPTTWMAYFNQQMRWAAGCLDILLRYSLIHLPKMRVTHALNYFFMKLFYFNGLATMAGIGLLMFYFATGIAPVEVGLLEMVVYYAPILVFRQIVIRWLQRFTVRPDQESGWYVAGRLLTIITMPIYFLALVSVVIGKRITFKVTKKGDAGRVYSIRAFAPHTLIMAILASATLLGVSNGNTSPILMGWSIITLALYGVFVGLTYGVRFSVFCIEVARIPRLPALQNTSAQD